jgi:acetoin utilization protein AcuB
MPDHPDQNSAAPPETIQARITVGQIMSCQVVTITMDDTLAKAQALFNEFRFHHLLVVEQEQLVGVISDRDLLKASSPFTGTMNETTRDVATLSKRIHQIMNRALITVDKETPIDCAAQLLIDKRISCLPVMTEDGTVEGIVTWRDLLKAYAYGAHVMAKRSCRPVDPYVDHRESRSDRIP